MTAMNAAYHTTTTVLPGQKIEIATPELREGEQVQVIVIRATQPAAPERRSGLDIIESYKGPPLFGSVEAVEEYLKQERESWAR
jgi:hypothetical protein